jgi:tetratricopeptide (TPR) repeat protein
MIGSHLKLLSCMRGSCGVTDKPKKQMTRLTLSVPFVMAISALLNARISLAQSPRDWSQCIGGEGPADSVIEGCTAVIRAGQGSPRNLATAFDNRGVAYRRKGDYEHALQDYDQATRLNPDNATAYNNRGIIYRIKGDYDRAIADYDEAIWLRNGDFPAAFYNRALAYADKGEAEHSLADFDIVLRFNAKNALALYARGLTLLKKGDAEAGAADIAAAKSINPNIAEQFDHSESSVR